MEMMFIIIGIIVVLGLVLKFYQTSTEKNQIIIVLALSITLTLMCPLVGIIPLYYSIKAWINNPLWEKELKSAYKWAKRCAIIYVVFMFVSVILYIILMYCAYYNVDLSWLF